MCPNVLLRYVAINPRQSRYVASCNEHLPSAKFREHRRKMSLLAPHYVALTPAPTEYAVLSLQRELMHVPEITTGLSK